MGDANYSKTYTTQPGSNMVAVFHIISRKVTGCWWEITIIIYRAPPSLRLHLFLIFGEHVAEINTAIWVGFDQFFGWHFILNSYKCNSVAFASLFFVSSNCKRIGNIGHLRYAFCADVITFNWAALISICLKMFLLSYALVSFLMVMEIRGK